MSTRWRIRRAFFGALLLGPLAAAMAAPPKPAPAPVPPGVRASLGAGFRRVEVVPTGRLLGVALPRSADGRRRVVLLVAEAPPAATRAVEVLDLERAETTTLAAGLSAGIDTIDAIDLDGDGTQEVILGEPGHLFVLGGSSGAATVQPLAADGWFDLAAPRPERLRSPAADRHTLVTAEAGRVRCFAPEGRVRDPQGSAGAAGEHRLVETCDAPLPLTAERETRGLLLQTPPVSAVPRDGAPPLVVVGPQTVDPRRLRTLSIEPGAAGAPAESWSRLPGAESVQHSSYAQVAGKTVLAVTTVRGDKLSLFEDQKLRLFHLGADRTQAGRAPFFTADTVSPRWHDVELFFGDIDGDRNDDLVLVEPKGMDGKPLWVQAYRGDADGKFSEAGKPSKLDLDDTLWSFGADVTGDHIPDLVAVGEEAVRIFAGQAPGRDGPVNDQPARAVPLVVGGHGELQIEVGNRGVRARAERYGWSRPFVSDLDGDGRGEILLLAIERDAPGVLEVITWR